MNKAWVPAVSPPSLAAALSIPYQTSGPMNPWLYRELLEAKLAGLMQADPQQARDLMQMSSEHAPVLWSISRQVPQRDWPNALVRSDAVEEILSGLSWEGTIESDLEPQSLSEILEVLAA